MLLGIDIGTTHIKVGQYSRYGTVLAHVKAATPKAFVEGFEHYLADEIWLSVSKLIRQALEISQEPVEALAVASMGETGIFLDKEGSPVYPMIPWNDHRAYAQCKALSEALNPDDWFAITGLYPTPIHSVFKWQWLADRLPELWSSPLTWLSSMGFVRFKLCNEQHFELSQAARTMAYDVTKAQWSTDILKLIGMPESTLPDLVSATSCVGSISREASERTNLKQGTPVFAGGHDHICASLACGILNSDSVLDSMGTAEGLTFGLATTPDPKKVKGFGVGPHMIAGYSYLLGGLYSSGGSLNWLKDLFELPSFDDLGKLVQTVDIGKAPFFVPHFFGAAPPFTNPAAKGAFLGLEPYHTKADLARAVYEGIAFEVRRHIEVFEDLTGEPLKLVKVVGQPENSELWMQIRSSILGKELELTQHADMVTLGAALVAGIGAQIYDSPQEAIQLSYKAGERIHVNPRWQVNYEEIYQRYKASVISLTGSHA